MVEPIYVPVLPTRRDAWTAYEALDPLIRRRIAPLWTLVPHTGPERTRGVPAALEPAGDQAASGRWLTPRVDRLITAMDGGPGWVDAAHVEGRGEGAAVGLWRLATRSRLRLVTGPERDPTLQRYTADLAFLSGRGLGIRLLLDEPPDEPCSTRLLELLDRLCLPVSQTDLILDMGAATEGDETAKNAIAALDLLGTLRRWRTVVLTSGAFPRTPDQPATAVRYEVRRHDRQLHHAVRVARPGFPTRVMYGDYSVEHAFSANAPSGDDQYGPPWGLLRYTTPDSFLIARAPLRGRERVDRVRAAARWITESGWFRGADHSAGERWLHACAGGEGSGGSGNAETWIKAGHIQHLNFAVHQLMGTWA
ncbi:hypothetical protein [Streptomyces sp. NPDC050121]|uniref:beta family protein n=1 Tax=Streptomyces sp. NPDC050121 TaxID=3365601 RepID=UPI00379D574D